MTFLVFQKMVKNIFPGTKRPYQEEVIISEVSYSLDNPANNTIKVQNYKTRFEDLFQRVAAATQSLQYHEGKYDKASNIVKEEKEKSPWMQRNLL